MAERVSVSLAAQAAQLVARSAMLYLERSGLNADPVALQGALRARCARELPAALREMQDAYEAVGVQWAMEGFRANMALIGVRAAKDVTTLN